MRQVSLFGAAPVLEKSQGADPVPVRYRVAWTYTGWRAAQWGERHQSELMTREEARRLYASRCTMVGVGVVSLKAELA